MKKEKKTLIRIRNKEKLNSAFEDFNCNAPGATVDPERNGTLRYFRGIPSVCYVALKSALRYVCGMGII